MNSNLIQWADFFVFLICFFAFLKFLRKTLRTNELIFAGFCISSLAISLYFLANPMQGIISQYNMQYIGFESTVKEWASIIAVSFILAAIAILIRNAKPPFARFPLHFTALPLLLIAVHPLAVNTIVLKYWLMGIYQGGAILVGLMMYSVMAMHDSKFVLILISVVLFAVSFGLYWFTPYSYINEAWKISFSAAIILAVYGYDKLEKAYLSFEVIENQQSTHKLQS